MASDNSSSQRANTGSQKQDYASSMYSESTTYSFSKEPAEAASNSKRTFRQKVKDTFKDVGYPPTRRYDMEHGARPADVGGPFASNQRGTRS